MEHLKQFIAGVMLVTWYVVMGYLLYPDSIQWLPAPTSFLSESDGWHDPE